MASEPRVSKPGTAILWLATAALVAGSAGCSAALVKGPPPDHARREVLECTTSPLPPIVDAAFVIGSGVAAYAALSEDGSPDSAVAIISLGAMATFGASLAYGVVETSACHSAVKERSGKGRFRIRALAATDRYAPRDTDEGREE